MRQSFKAILACSVFMLFGCSSYRYHDPQKPHHGPKGFLNNYDNSPKANFWKWQWERWTSKKEVEKPFEPEVIKTDTAALKSNKDRTLLTWVGHSTFLLQVPGLNILTDPVFSERVSPFTFAGPKRQVALPFPLQELPEIDVVVVSHSHYDHLDIETLKQLNARSNAKTKFLVPLGNADWLSKEGLHNVQEFDWWENVEIKGMTFTFTPAQHWTARGLFDNNETLWGGWHLQNEKLRLHFVGDTGYSKDFQDIAAKLGPVDVALVPIGAYEPRWFMKQQHVNPEEAVQIHKDLQAKRSIGMHWGTFRLTDEPMIAPTEALTEALKKAQLPANDFIFMKHGATESF